jgi:hypothetical protein
MNATATLIAAAITSGNPCSIPLSIPVISCNAASTSLGAWSAIV